jgi:hypothetical protein
MASFLHEQEQIKIIKHEDGLIFQQQENEIFIDNQYISIFLQLIELELKGK